MRTLLVAMCVVVGAPASAQVFLTTDRDPTDPYVFIYDPRDVDYTSDTTSVIITGDSFDFGGGSVSSVPWTCDNCTVTSGTATGTAPWSQALTLGTGLANTICVTAIDNEANETATPDCITITHSGSDTTPPTIVVTNTNPDITATTPRTVSGTSADNVAVDSVTTAIIAGACTAGAVTGTTSWSFSATAADPAVSADCTIRVTASDAANNTVSVDYVYSFRGTLNITTTTLTDCETGTAKTQSVFAAGGILPVTWSESGSALGVGACAEVSAAQVGTRWDVTCSATALAGTCNFTAQIDDSDSPTPAQDTQALSLQIGQTSTNLATGNPCPDHQYQDLSTEPTPVCRDRLTSVGADITTLDALFGGTTENPACTLAAINAAIVTVNGAGGGVVNIPSCTLNINDNDQILLLSDVILQGAGEGSTIISVVGDEDTGYFPVYLNDLDRVVVQDLTIDLNTSCLMGVRMFDTSDVLLQRLTILNSAENSVSVVSSHDMTFRYLTIDANRSDLGTGDCDPNFVSHGLGLKSCFSYSGCSFPLRRTTYSHHLSAYSNDIDDTDGYCWDNHADFSEIMGNTCTGSRWGVKYPNSGDHFMHHNIVEDIDQGRYVFQIYDEPTGEEVGSPANNADDVVIFSNIFRMNWDQFVRFDSPTGELWLLGNSWASTRVNMGFGQGDTTWEGTLYYCAGSQEESERTAGRWLGVTQNSSIEASANVCNLVPASLLALTNLPAP